MFGKHPGMIKHACMVGCFFVLLYVVCLLYGAVLTDPALVDFHMLSLKVWLPGFKGYDVISVIWGGILSYLYGFVASYVFHSFHKDCCGPR